MNLDMWFKDDIRNMLLGIDFASMQNVSGLSSAEQTAFRNGFRAALLAVAASFGIVERDAPPLTPGTTPRLAETRRLMQR